LCAPEGRLTLGTSRDGGEPIPEPKVARLALDRPAEVGDRRCALPGTQLRLR